MLRIKQKPVCDSMNGMYSIVGLLEIASYTYQMLSYRDAYVNILLSFSDNEIGHEMKVTVVSATK